MSTKTVKLNIPKHLDFSLLKLGYEPNGDISLDWDAVEALCTASGLNSDHFRYGPEDNISALIVAWYDEHRARGGAPDPVAEELFSETVQELVHGSLPHQPGRA